MLGVTHDNGLEWKSALGERRDELDPGGPLVGNFLRAMRDHTRSSYSRSMALVGWAFIAAAVVLLVTVALVVH